MSARNGTGLLIVLAIVAGVFLISLAMVTQ